MPQSDEDGGILLNPMRDEVIPASTVDVGDLLIRGRERVRTRRRLGICAAACAAAAAIAIPAVLYETHNDRATPPAVEPSPPNSCAVQRLDLPPGSRSAQVYGGDSSGRYLAGLAYNATQTRQVVWVDGKVMAPGLPSDGFAPVVNAKGEVAGFGNNLPYVYRGGRFIPLRQPDGYASYRPIAINNRGEILGIYVEASEGRMLIWGPDGRITRVADKPFVPTGFDDDGTVVGLGDRGFPGDVHGVIWREGSAVADLPSPPGMGRLGPRTLRAGWAGGVEGSPAPTDAALPSRIWNVHTGQSEPVPPDVTYVRVVNSHGWAGVDLGNRPGLLVSGKVLRLPLPPGVGDTDSVTVEALSDDGRAVGGSILSGGAATTAAVLWRCA